MTNASWEQFYINEGFTMFVQRRITTAVYDAAFTALQVRGTSYFCMEANIACPLQTRQSRRQLADTIRGVGFGVEVLI